ncbi:MAG: hypothetical protein R6V05_11365 [Candidatus Brocadiia bacterium]
MILKRVGMLPDVWQGSEPAWLHWQVSAIRKLAGDLCRMWPTSPVEIAGCLGEEDGALPVSPDDYPHPDSLGVFYSDGDEDLAEWWASFLYMVLARVRDGIDWPAVRPASIKKRAERAGLQMDQFRPRRFQRIEPTVVSSPEEIDAIEDSKSDECDLDLVRFSPVLDGDDSRVRPIVSFALSYIEHIAGPAPDGVQLSWLWRASERCRVVPTGKQAKVHDGWGLVFEPCVKREAIAHAERFRFAYYSLLGSTDWTAFNPTVFEREFEQSGIFDSMKRTYGG